MDPSIHTFHKSFTCEDLATGIVRVTPVVPPGKVCIVCVDVKVRFGLREREQIAVCRRTTFLKLIQRQKDDLRQSLQHLQTANA